MCFVAIVKTFVARDRKALQQVIKTHRTSLVPIYQGSIILVWWGENIPTSQNLFMLLPSAKRYKSIHCCTTSRTALSSGCESFWLILCTQTKKKVLFFWAWSFIHLYNFLFLQVALRDFNLQVVIPASVLKWYQMNLVYSLVVTACFALWQWEFSSCFWEIKHNTAIIISRPLTTSGV